MTHEKYKIWIGRAMEFASSKIGNLPKNHKFVWSGRGFYNKTIGCTIWYDTKTDLTASILLWFFDHQIGDVPQFFLGDLIDSCSGLWDWELDKVVWELQLGGDNDS